MVNDQAGLVEDVVRLVGIFCRHRCTVMGFAVFIFPAVGVGGQGER